MTKTYWTLERVREEAKKYSKPSEFKSKSGGAYSAARRNGWLDEVRSHMNYTPPGYWNFDKCLEVAKTCKTRSEFQYGVGNKSAYGAAQKNGWLKDMYQHIEEVRKPRGYWTLDKVKAEAKKYSSRVDFENSSATAYGFALKHKVMDDVCSHMEHIGNRASRCIYAIFSLKENEAYIGLTFSFQKRMLEHKNGHGRSTAKLVTYPDTKFIQLTDYIEAEQAAELEAKFVIEYSDKGFKMHNNTSAIGALGGKEPWTLDRIKLEAKKYSTRIEFKKGSSSAYRIACNRGWLENVTSHMPKKIVWSFENVRDEALKYQTRKEFEQGNSSAYVVANRKGWADEVCSHMHRQKPMTTKKWTKEAILTLALNYSSKQTFRKENRGAYASACRNEWIEEIYKLIEEQ